MQSQDRKHEGKRKWRDRWKRMQGDMLFCWPPLHSKLCNRYDHVWWTPHDIITHAVERKYHRMVHRREKKRVLLFHLLFLIGQSTLYEELTLFSFIVLFSKLFTASPKAQLIPQGVRLLLLCEKVIESTRKSRYV